MPNHKGRIAFVDTLGRVCTMRPDGSDLRRLSEPGLFFQNPAWSPHGRRVAAIGIEGGGAGVYCFNDEARGFGRGGSRPRELYFGQVQAPVYLNWSPTGEHLSFLVAYPQSLALYVADPNAGQNRLLETGRPFFWDWLPDGAYMLIHTDAGQENGRVNFIDTDGEDWGENLSAPGRFQAPAVSSDGRYWAFAAATADEQSELVVEHHLTGEQLRLPHEGAVAMAWQPGGHRLAYIAPADEAQHFFGPLRLLDVAAEKAEVLVDDTIFAHFWSPDGRTIAYLTLGDPPAAGNRVNLRLWVWDLATEQSRALTDFNPPVVFLDQFLPFFDQYSRSHRLWAPDSSALVVPTIIAETTQLLVVPVAGDKPWSLGEGFMPCWSPV